MPRARHKRRRHLRASKGRAACDTWSGDSSSGWARAPLRTTREQGKVTCLRCLATLDAPARAPTVEGAAEVTNGWYARALECAQGSYQRGLVEGRELLSGKNRPGHWRAVYRQQASNLLERMTRAGVPWRIEVRGKQHKHVLVIGG